MNDFKLQVRQQCKTCRTGINITHEVCCSVHLGWQEMHKSTVAVLARNICMGGARPHGERGSAYNGSLGHSRQRGPLVRETGGLRQSPPEAEALLVTGRSMKAANLPIFLQLENAKNQIFVLFLQKIMGGYESGELEQNWGALPARA